MSQISIKSFVIAVLFVSFVVSPVLAAGGNVIDGRVKDQQTGDPLPGAAVLLEGTSLGAATDLDGKFEIRNVPPGHYTVRTTYVGYKTSRIEITVEMGKASTLDVGLQAVGVQGKEVVVTAQASGQNGAINQQLTSDRIVNVVSAARIQELPDANAAESVGRLPGVSLIREGGQATQVVIRGLAPQYNQITIDGVQMPANVNPGNPSDLNSAYSSGDRAVDLSMISSSMLGGIEVTKAITPDMDAAVLGGVVNFNLREAQTSAPEVHLLAQGGYDNLKSTYNDYKFVATAEKRFFNDKFGVFAEGDVEQENLSANELGAGYALNSPKLGAVNPTFLSGVTLTDIPRTQKRYDGTVTLDYRLPEGKIDFMNFYSYGTTNEVDRAESFNLIESSNNHIYSLQEQLDRLAAMTNILDFQKQVSGFDVDAKLSNAYSVNSAPYMNTWTFVQPSPTGYSTLAAEKLSPQSIPAMANDSLQITGLDGLTAASSISTQRNVTASLDIKTNANFSDEITSTIKFGGSFMYTSRSYNFQQYDGNVEPSGANVIQGIENQYPWMIPTINKYGPILPLFADSSYSYGNFLGGGYKLGLPINLGLMEQVLAIAKKTGTLESYSYDATQSGEHNYSGKEYRSAGYGMMTVHFGPNFTLLPGVRYQVLETSYTAPRASSQLGPFSRYVYDHKDTTVDVAHGYWLPMVHLIYNPTTWLQVHLAYTHSITYPDYSAITPELQVGTSSVDYHNYLLKPGTSANYDATISAYDNTIGLFSVDGFYKQISDLIFATGQTYVLNASQYPGVPTYAEGYSINTSINDPYVADVYGIEADWQTHFWYFPGPLSGLILDVNYTHVVSKAKYPYTYVNIVRQYPLLADTVVTFFSDRLLDQPNDIMNVTLGYDYGGFAARVSMLYNSNIFEAYNFWPQLRSNTQQYLRWDASVKQDLPWAGLEVFLDLNNINGARDTQINQGSDFPSAENLYGMTADLGLRLRI